MENPSTLLVVDDLLTSKEFYIKALGANLEEEHDDGIKLKVAEHVLLMFQGSMTAVDYEHGYHACSTLVFTVDNLDEKIDELKSYGVEFIHSSPNQNRWGRYAAFKAPCGIVHELMEYSSPFKTKA
ncbi:VOC family protein [Thalassotalea aquiviva]|uniref:VOC family protein n=1 Tax=Thalassotalea aquiviva TaxID=3242415 RepID=UPI003529E05A